MSDLDDFKTRLKIAKSKLEKNNLKNNGEKATFVGNAFKLGTELVAAVVVGTIIGFILDNWFDTKPVLIIILFLFGSAAGIVNVIKAAKRMQNK
jgi:ATP synthase protein I